MEKGKRIWDKEPCSENVSVPVYKPKLYSDTLLKSNNKTLESEFINLIILSTVLWFYNLRKNL